MVVLTYFSNSIVNKINNSKNVYSTLTSHKLPYLPLLSSNKFKC